MSDETAGAPAAGHGVMTRSQAVFIGVGAMVGAGIFTLLGEAGKIAQSAVWLSFLAAGPHRVAAGLLVRLPGQEVRVAVRSRRLHRRRLRQGKPCHVHAGVGVWASTVIVIAMVATSFGTYGAALFTGGEPPATLIKVLATAIVLGSSC